MGSYEAHFLQMKPYLISHMKIVCYPMLIVVFLVLGFSFLQNFMNLLMDVVDSFNKFGFSINLDLSMGGLFLCSCNGKIYVNGG